MKLLNSPVAGEADIVLVADLESGNMLAKQLEYLGGPVWRYRSRSKGANHPHESR